MRGWAGVLFMSGVVAGAMPAIAGDHPGGGGSGGLNVAGHVEAAYRLADPAGPDNSINIWALRGTLHVADGGKPQLQADIAYEDYNLAGLHGSTIDGAVHISMRPTDSFAIGAYTQAARFTTSNLQQLGIAGLDSSADEYIVGAQAAYINEMGVVYGQAGAGRTHYGAYRGDRYALKLGARTLVGDNFRLDVEGAYNRLQAPGWGINVYSLGAQGNYRFDSAPVSVFARYEVDRLTYDENGVQQDDSEMRTVSAGLRLHFGSDSLRQETLNGPLWSANRAYYQ